MSELELTFDRRSVPARPGQSVGAARAGGAEGAGHHDWKRFAGLRSRLYAQEKAGRLRYLRGMQLWLVEAAAPAGPWRLRMGPTVDSAPVETPAPEQVEAAHLILCPGGSDRQLPVPGWDLPGVVAGTGPFLLPVATGLAAAGVKVAAICEANAPSGRLRHAAGAARAPGHASTAEDLRAMSKRSLAAPVSLGHLASLAFPASDFPASNFPDPEHEEPTRAEKDLHHD